MQQKYDYGVLCHRPLSAIVAPKGSILKNLCGNNLQLQVYLKYKLMAINFLRLYHKFGKCIKIEQSMYQK
jgi:hypothetical protein